MAGKTYVVERKIQNEVHNFLRPVGINVAVNFSFVKNLPRS